MTAIKLRRGTLITIDGVVWRVDRRTASGEIVVEDVHKTLAPQIYADSQIAALVRTGGAEFLPPEMDEKQAYNVLLADFGQLPEELKKTAYLRRDYVLAAMKRHVPSDPKAYKEFIAEIANLLGDANPPSRATLFRWIRRWLMCGGRDIRALVPGFHLRGNYSQRLADEVEDVIAAAIDDVYMRAERLSIRAVHDAIESTIKKLNESLPEGKPHYKVPPPRTVARKIAARDKYEKKRARYGKRAADQDYRPVGVGPEATRPLEVVEIDHTPLDSIIVTKEGAVLGRPWVSAAIDRYTRMIVGIYVTFDAPSANSVLCCLRTAILDKAWVKDAYPEIKGDWDCYGIPENIVVDRGPEFHSEALTDACAQLGICLHYCPRKSPWYKGKIERWFRTMMTQLGHQLPGTTFSNVAERGDYEAELRAGIAFDDFVMLLLGWIIDVYCLSPHAGIRDVPKRRWEEGTRNHPIRHFNRIEDLDCLLGGFAIRTPRRDGIELEGIRYNSDELKRFRARGNAPENVKIRFDPSDLGQIRVLDPATAAYFVVPTVDEYAIGLSLAQHKAIRRYLAEKVEGYVNTAQLSIARDQLRRKADALCKETHRRTRVRAARLLGGLNSSESARRATVERAANFMGEAPESLRETPSQTADTGRANMPDQVTPPSRRVAPPGHAGAQNPEDRSTEVDDDLDLDLSEFGIEVVTVGGK